MTFYATRRRVPEPVWQVWRSTASGDSPTLPPLIAASLVALLVGAALLVAHRVRYPAPAGR